MGNFPQRISHFLVKSIQKQLDKLNKRRNKMLDRESKNLGEFQYPTNLTPFYLHRRCSISENVKDYSVDVWESIKTESPPGRRGGREECLVLCYIVVWVFTGVLLKLNNFPNKEKMISFPLYLERL